MLILLHKKYEIKLRNLFRIFEKNRNRKRSYRVFAKSRILKIRVLNSAIFKLITTRIKTTSSKTGGEVGFSRRKVVIFLKNKFEKAEFKTRIFKIRGFANTLIDLVCP